MRYLLLISTLFFINLASAQWSWPVQVNSFTTGPYYNYLSYYGDQNDHLQILITLTDQNATSVPAKLRLRIEGAGWWVETKPNNNIPPFNLEPFVPNVISGGFLQPYLLQSNLIKSDPSLDLNNLPEGYTEVCVEVIGVGGTLTTIGGNQCTPFWLQRFQPPQAFVPQCGAQLDTNSMFHNFQWTVPIGYTPTIGSDLEYTFSLYEWVDQNNYTIFQTGQGLVYQTTVNNIEQLVLSDFDVQLQNGMDYVWRVQAQLYDNGMPISMFENNGLSEICTFTYGEAQALEEQLTEGLYIDLSAMANTQYKGSANWVVTDQVSGGLSTYNSYFIEYRLKPDQEHPSPIWHYDTVYSTAKALYQLSPERTYQVRVSGMAGNFTSDPTPIVEFTTPAAVDYACGDVQVPYRPSTVIPNENIIAGDQVQIGQFVMTITEAIPQYEAGRYAGQGLIPVEFLGGAKARVTFTDILIDKDYIVHEGRVDVTTDGVDAWLNEQMQDYVDPIYVDGTVDSAWVDTTAGVAWVVIDGVQHEFVFDPPDYPIVIHDNSGMAWTIYPNGVITVSGYLDPSNDHLDVSADSVAVFAQSATERFGFDAKQHMEWHENYEIIQLTDSSYYFVPNKSIGKNAVDTVDINLAYATTPTFKLDDETTLGFSQQSGNTYSVYIPDISSTGGHEIYAYDDNDQRLGKLNVQVYKQKERELIVVPIANTTVNASQLKAVLDQTLGEANLNVSVSVAPQWNDTTFTTSKTIALPEDLSVMTDYSQDMRDLRNAYFADTSNEKNSNAYYLFVIPEFDDPNTDGYMVKGKALGFIKGNNYQTYAHELAHGMGGLGHTWKFNGPAQGSTDNLMDYASGNNVNLTKAQWKELRDFDLAPSMWDDVEDEMYAALLYKDNGLVFRWEPESPLASYNFQSFYTPGGKTIKVNKANLDPTILLDPLTGAVVEFNYSGNDYYPLYTEIAGRRKFYGYIKEGWWPIVESELLLPPMAGQNQINIAYSTLRYDGWVAIMENYPEFFFTDFEIPSATDKALAVVEANDSCGYQVIAANYQGQSYELPSFDDGGHFTAPLFGEYKGLGDSLSSYVTIDADTYIPAGLLTAEQEQLFCEIIRLYNEQGSWQRRFLERQVNKLGFSDVTDLLVQFPEGIQAIKRIVVVYEDLGSHLIEHYNAKFSETETLDLFDQVMIEALDLGEFDVQYAKLLDYANKIEGYQSSFKEKLKQLHKTSDEDIVTDLVTQTFDKTELGKLTKNTRLRLLKCLVKDWMFNGEEAAALRIIESTPSSQATDLLEEMLEPRNIRSINTGSVVAPNIFAAIYSRIDGSENQRYVEAMLELWAKSDYYNTAHSAFNYQNKPLVYDYTSKSQYGFYNSNYNFDVPDDFSYVRIQQELPSTIGLTGNLQNELIADAFISLSMEANDWNSYHPLQPIGVMDIDQDGTVTMPSNKLPAFLLYAFDDMSGSANLQTAIELAIDVVSTFVGGVGILKNLKHLSKLKNLTTSKKILVGTKMVEFTSGTANIVLEYTCDDNTEWCKDLQSILTLVEISALSGDAIYGAIARQKAKQFRSNSSNMDLVDEMPEGVETRKFLDDLTGQVSARHIDGFIPSSGTKLIGNPNKTTTILGRWTPDMQQVIQYMLPNDFNVGTQWGNLQENLGSFNFLKVPDHIAYASENFFNEFNRPWLQEAINRGDDVILATRPTNQIDYMNLQTGELTGMFSHELQFLVQNDYKPVNLTETEWDTIKSWYQ